MNTDSLFSYLSSEAIAEMVLRAKHSVCYAAPGIQTKLAQAMVQAASRLGVEMLSVCIDFDERVMRMGYGELEAVQCLRQAGIVINHSPGLRNGLIIVDGEGYSYTPTALLLEADSKTECARNALRLSHDQVAEALARLSPSAKIIAIAQAQSEEDKSRIAGLPVEVGFIAIDKEQFGKVERALKEAPPVQFDMARQVHVFNAYFQYVELKLTGASIQRRKLVIPSFIQGIDKDIKGRLRTTFNLLASDSTLSSKAKALDQKLREIRDTYTPSLGHDRGRIVLKNKLPRLKEELVILRAEKDKYEQEVRDNLQDHIDESLDKVVEYYLPLIMKSVKEGTAPKNLYARVASDPPSEEDTKKWLTGELGKVFPSAESLIGKMEVTEDYKDVTFETLNNDAFKNRVKEAFPTINWDNPYDEFYALGEKDKQE